jgi:hypothetical protein
LSAAVSRRSFVPVFVSVTLAPGITPPVESVMVPTMEPYTVCALASEGFIRIVAAIPHVNNDRVQINVENLILIRDLCETRKFE